MASRWLCRRCFSCWACSWAWVLATSMSLRALARRLSRACSRWLNLSEITEVRVQAEFWVGTGGAEDSQGPGLPTGLRGGEPRSLCPPPPGPLFPAARRHFQSSSCLLSSVPGAGWWPPEGRSTRTWRGVGGDRPDTWIWLLRCCSSCSCFWAWVVCCWVTSSVALSWACGPTGGRVTRGGQDWL